MSITNINFEWNEEQEFPEVVSAANSFQNFNSIFKDSPFGENWHRAIMVFDDGNDGSPPPRNEWRYYVERDTDALKLIDHYENDNSVPDIEHGSSEDTLRDITIYYEIADGYDTFAPICYAKTNRAFASVLSDKIHGEEWRKYLVKEVVETYKKEGVNLDEKRIRKAINFELDASNGKLGLLAKLGSWLLQELAEFIRGMKVSEKRWNADLEKYDPVIPVKLIDNTVNGWKNFKKKTDSFFKSAKDAGTWCNEKLPIIGSFIKVCLDAIIDLFSTVINAIDKFFDLIAEFSHILKLVNAFICGAINEIIEVIAAVIDLLALLIRSIDPIEQDKIKKALEAVIEEFRKNPSKIWEIIKEGFENLKIRYNSDAGEYQKAYNLGEDMVTVLLLAEAIIGIARVLKNIPEAFKNLKEWIKSVEKRIKRLMEGPGPIKKKFNDLSNRISETLKGRVVVQSTNNLDDLYAAAKEANKELKDVTERFAKETNGKAGIRPASVNKGLKTKERAIEKVTAEYGGDTSQLLDIAGSKVVYETLDDLYLALEKFEKQFEILRFKDRILEPLANGYRDILMNIRMNNGHIVEFRLHLRAIDDVAAIEHDTYKIIRSIQAKAGSEKRNLTPKEIATIIELNSKAKKLYEKAWNKIIN